MLRIPKLLSNYGVKLVLMILACTFVRICYYTVTASPVSEAIKSKCNATAVEEGQSATITCYFPTNDSIESFRLFKLDDKVLECDLSKNKPVFKKDFFDCDCKITDNKLTVIIHETKLYHAGKYACIIPLSGNKNVEKCQLEVREKDTGFRIICYISFALIGLFIIGILCLCGVCYKCPKLSRCCSPLLRNIQRRLEYGPTPDHTAN